MNTGSFLDLLDRRSEQTRHPHREIAVMAPRPTQPNMNEFDSQVKSVDPQTSCAAFNLNAI
jgi:hypothetical protein